MSKVARILFFAVYLLVGLGVVMTYSASAIYAEYVYKNPQFLMIRQILYVFIGTLGLFAVSAIPVLFWREHARAVILSAIALLVMVYLPGIGHSAGGARRWLHIGFINFQPIEFAKIAVCIYLADYLSRKIKVIKKGGLLVFLPPLILVGMVCGLALLQPDLGSCAFIFILITILFFVAGIPARFIFIAGLAVIPLICFLVMREPYRMARVLAYLNPWDDPQGSGFQMIQSLIAFGLGGLNGVGLGESTQKLFYLPSAYNDFIFAVIAEELGLFGTVAVIALFLTVFFCGMNMANNSKDLFERIMIQALTFLIVLQALLNMMVATGLLPTKGLPLPFVSYGGTSIVSDLMAIGLILGVDRQRYGSGRR